MEIVDLTDFQKLEIRIGQVTKAEVPEWSHWVMKLTVDFGEFGEKTVFAGIIKFYHTDDLIGKQFPFVINIKPKKIGPKGEFSEGMMLMADLDNDNQGEVKPVFIMPSDKVPNGVKVK